MIRPSVLMLERGEIFEIDGKSCFAFGGARSHDIMDGILNPADYPDEQHGFRVGTAAYHAERELDTLMYEDSGIYRSL